MVRSFLPVLVAVWLVPGSAFSLERLQKPVSDPSWFLGTDTAIYYYNACLDGYRFLNIAEGVRVGVVFDGIDAGQQLLSSTVFLTEAPCEATYGFQEYARVGVYAVTESNDLVGAPLAEKSLYADVPWNPAGLTCWGWAPSEWGGLEIPERFAVVVTGGGVWYGPAYEVFLTDSPDHGACRPLDDPHTFSYGTEEHPTPPAPILEEGGSSVELLLRAQVTGTVSVERTTWGKIKGMYR